MKLVGSYTSPFVRKLSILLLEKGITFEFINELPYNADNGVAQFNPLGKVPVLVTEEGECWFDSPIIAEYIELMNVAPAMLPRDPLESLRVRKIEALADGIMDAGLVSVREQARPAAQLLCRITGAEDACIVNNNAAAVLLMLAATASGKEVVVSRGELVEIGGAFRIPDVMRQAGCTLHEVGTTNRTHANDYRQAVNENTALLMKVHTSNYSIQGFTKAIDEAELVALGKELDVPVVTDLGSGSLVDLSQYGLPKEPMPQELIAAGVSLVSFSGDKLLGGPQAGIIVGKKEMIARLQSHPLKRALRADKMTLAALEATLRLYLHPEALSEKLPTLRLLTRSAEVIQIQAQRLQAPLAAHYGAEFAVQVMPCLSQIGSGSLPVDRLPSAALTFTPHDGRGSHLESLAARWRELPVPVIGRIYDGRLWLDLRCLEDEQRFLEMLLK